MVCCAGKPRGLAGEVPGKPGADMSPGAETKPIDLGDVGLVAEAPPAKGKKSSSPAKPVDAGAEAAPVAEKTNAAEIDASAPAATMPEVAAGGTFIMSCCSTLINKTNGSASVSSHLKIESCLRSIRRGAEFLARRTGRGGASRGGRGARNGATPQSNF